MKTRTTIFAAALSAVLALAAPPAAATTVTTEAELKNAIAAGGAVTLGADIAVSQEIQIGNTVALDLATFAITSETNVFQVVSNGNFTVTADATSPGGIYTASNRCCIYTAYGLNPGPKTVVINGGVFDGNCVFNFSPDAASNVYVSEGILPEGYGSGEKAVPTSVTINGGTFQGGLEEGNVGEYRCYYFTVNGGTFEKGLDSADTPTCSIGVTTTCKAYFKGGRYRNRYPTFRRKNGADDPGKVFIGTTSHTNVYYIAGGYYVNAYDYSDCAVTATYSGAKTQDANIIIYWVTQCWQKWYAPSATWYFLTEADAQEVDATDITPIGGTEATATTENVATVAKAARTLRAAPLLAAAATEDVPIAKFDSTGDATSVMSRPEGVAEDAWAAFTVDSIANWTAKDTWSTTFATREDPDSGTNEKMVDRTDTDGCYVFSADNITNDAYLKGTITEGKTIGTIVLPGTTTYDNNAYFVVSADKAVAANTLECFFFSGCDKTGYFGTANKRVVSATDTNAFYTVPEIGDGESSASTPVPYALNAKTAVGGTSVREMCFPIAVAIRDVDGANAGAKVTVSLCQDVNGSRIVRASFTHKLATPVQPAVAGSFQEYDKSSGANVHWGDTFDINWKDSNGTAVGQVYSGTRTALESAFKKITNVSETGLESLVTANEGETLEPWVQLEWHGLKNVQDGKPMTTTAFGVTPQLRTRTDSGSSTRTITNEEIGGKKIRFRLPLTDSFTSKVLVVHESEGYPTEYSILPVEGTDGAKYVEIATTHFSEFTVAPADENTVACIGYTPYTNLMEAVSAAFDGGTVEVLADVSISKWHQNIWSYDEAAVWQDSKVRSPTDAPKNLTIHGNNHKVTIASVDSGSNGNYLFMAAENLAIDNLEIEITGTGNGPSMVSGTLENVTIKTAGGNAVTASRNCASADDYSADVAGVTIKNCTLDAGSGSPLYVYDGSDGRAVNLAVSGSALKTTSSGTFMILRSNEDIEGCTFESGTGGKITLTNNGIAGPATIKGNDFGVSGMKIYSKNNAEEATIADNVFSSASVIKRDGTDPVDLSANYWGGEAAPDFTADLAVVVDSYYKNYDKATGLSNLTTFSYVASVTTSAGFKQYEDLHESLEAGKAQGSVVTLLADVDLDNESWTPVDSAGSLDGNGKTVSNLTVGDMNTEGTGLFSKLTGNGYVKNLVISNVTAKAKSDVGALVGSTGNAYQYTNVVVTGVIAIEANKNAGGLIGGAYGTVTSCSVVGLEGSYIKGIYGGDNYEGESIGGLVGYAKEDMKANACSVSGLEITGFGKVGGMFGSSYEKQNLTNLSVKDVTIGCSPESGSEAWTYVSGNPAKMGFGGLVGLYNSNYTTGTISGTVSDVDFKFGGALESNPSQYVSYGLVTGGHRGSSSLPGNPWPNYYNTEAYSGLVAIGYDSAKYSNDYLVNKYVVMVTDADGSVVGGYANVDEALTAAKSNAGCTVTIFAGEYTLATKVWELPANVTIIGDTDSEGNNLVTLNNNELKFVAEDFTLKNVNIVATSGSALHYAKTSGIFEHVNITSPGNAIRECQIFDNGTMTFKDCNIVGGVYGIHYDTGTHTTINIIGGTLSGWNSFGSVVEQINIDGTTFAKGDSYNQLRLYQNAVVSNCTFNTSMCLDFNIDGKAMILSDCKTTDGSSVAALVSSSDLESASRYVAVGTGIEFDEDGKIVGGVFETVDATLIATGYLSEANTDGETSAAYPLTVGGPYEAAVYGTDGELKKGYAKLAAAIAAAQDGDTVKLVTDCEVASSIEITKSLTLDLAGHVLTNSVTSSTGNRVFTVTKVVDFTIDGTTSGSAMVIPASNTDALGFVTVKCTDDGLPSVTVNGGTYTGDTNNGTFFNTNTRGRLTLNNLTAMTNYRFVASPGSYAVLPSPVTVTGGTYTQHNAGLSTGKGTIPAFWLCYGYEEVSGGYSYGVSFTDVTITSDIGSCVELARSAGVFAGNTFKALNPNTIQSWNGCALALSSAAKAIIESGTYSGEYGVYAFTSGGTVTVEGGEITGTASGIVLSTDTNYGNESAAYIDGGTISGGIKVYGKVGTTVEVTGGTINGGFDIAAASANTTSVVVSGGTFDKEVQESYCAAGYVPDSYETEVDGETVMLYGVKPDPAKAARNVTKNLAYATLAEAVKEASDGDTVALLAANELTSAIMVGKTLTLDLNGFVLAGVDRSPITTSADGDLTVTDGVGTGFICRYGTDGTSATRSSGVCVSFTAGKFILAGGKIDQEPGTALSVGGTAVVEIVGGETGGAISVSSGELTVSGGALKREGTDRTTITVTGTGTLNVSGEAVITSSTGTSTAIRTEGNAVVNVSGGSVSARNAIDLRGGSVTVSGGTLKGDNVGLYGAQSGDVETTITVTGGTVTGDSIAINSGKGKITVSGGTVTGGTNAIKTAGANELAISGGTISSGDGTAVWAAGTSDSTVTITGGDIASGNGGIFIEPGIKCTFADATLSLTGNSGTAVTVRADGSFEMSSGTIHLAEPAAQKLFALAGNTTDSSLTAKVEVSGGYFTSAVADTCITSGKTTVRNVSNDPEPYTIGIAVAKIGSEQYATLADAIEDFADGDMIEFLSEYDLGSGTLELGAKSVVIGGEYGIKSSGAAAITLVGDGDVTIKCNVTATKGHGIQAGTDGKAYSGKLTLDGATVTVAKRGIRVYEEDTGFGITVNNSVIQSNKADPKTTYTTGNDAMGLSLGTTDGKGYTVTITDSTIQGFSYCINSVTSGSNLTVTMTGGATYGRAALNVWGSNNTLTLDGVKVHGLNNQTGPTEAFACIVDNSGATGNTYTINGVKFIAQLSDAAASESGSSATEQMVDLRSGNSTFNIRGNTTYTAYVGDTEVAQTDDNYSRFGLFYNEAALESNGVTLDNAALANLGSLVPEKATQNKDESTGITTLNYVSEVFYWWYANGEPEGGNCEFAQPFANSWLSDGEFLDLKKNVAVTYPIVWGEYGIKKTGGVFTVKQGEYELTIGEGGKLELPQGVTMKTDKAVEGITAAPGSALVSSTETADGTTTYVYASVAAVAQIGNTGYTSLQSAIDAAKDGETVTLLDDIDATASSLYTLNGNKFPIAKSLTIDGQNHTITVANRGFGVAGSAAGNVDVTFKDVTIKNSSSAARCIDTRGFLNSLTLDNVTLDTTGCTSGYNQPLTIGGNQAEAAKITIKNGTTIQTNDDASAYYAIVTFNPVDMLITNSTIKGWACVYAKGKDSSAGSAGSTIKIVDSTLVSHNKYSGTSNSFGALMLEDNNIKIDISGTKIDIIADSDQKQAIVGLPSNNTFSLAEVTLGEGNVVTQTGASPDNAVIAFNTSGSASTTQAKVSVSGGIFSAPVPLDFCAADYHPAAMTVTNEDGTTTIVYTVAEGAAVAMIEYVSEPTVYYTTLQAAIDGADAFDTVTLLRDVELNATLTIPQNASVALDLNEHTITAANDANKRIVVKGTAVVYNGTIKGTADALDEDNSVAMIRVDGALQTSITDEEDVPYGKLVVKDAINAIAAFGTGTVAIEAGTEVTAYGFALATNGSAAGSPNASNGVTIEVNGGKLTSLASPAVYLPSGTMTLNGGEIEGPTGVYAKGGTLVVPEDSTVTVTATGAAAEYAYNGNGASATGDALVIDNSGYPFGPAEVTIAGGVFKATNGGKAVGNYAKAEDGEIATQFIAGGWFSSVAEPEWCVAGKIPVFTASAEGLYTVEDGWRVIFANVDGEGKAVTNYVSVATVPTYDGTPARANSEEGYTYEFAGWSPAEIVAPVSNTVYTATFTQQIQVQVSVDINVPDATGDRYLAIVAVPVQEDDVQVTVANLISLSNRTAGDMIKVYNKSTGRYNAWTVEETSEGEGASATQKSWVPATEVSTSAGITVSPAPEAVALTPGQGVWVTVADNTKPLLLTGKYATGYTEITLAKGYNLVGAPPRSKDATTYTLKDFAAPQNSKDVVLLPTAGAPNRATWRTDKGWSYSYLTRASGTLERKWVYGDTLTIPAGTGFWYYNAGDDGATIEL